jgi:hypothetical protein
MALIPMLEGRAAMFAVVWSGVGGIGRSCVDEGGEFTPPLSSLRKSILRDNDKVQSNSGDLLTAMLTRRGCRAR